MKIQSSLYASSRSDYSAASTTIAEKVETTRTQVTQFTADVVPKAAKGGGFLSSSFASDTTGGIFGVMLEYQKMMNQEAREDRKLARAGAQLELIGKASEFALEQSKIARMRDEASEGFGQAMADADAQRIREHLQNGGYDSVQKREDVLTDRLKSGQGPQSIMDTLFWALKESIRETNETKKYYLDKLSSMNKLSESLSAQQEAVAVASQRLAKSETKDDDD